MIFRFFSKLMLEIKKIIIKIRYKNIRMGKNIVFRKNFTIKASKNSYVKIGDNCFFNNYFSLYSYENINIGNDCIFGENVKIYDHNHKFRKKNILIRKQGYSSKSIKIGNNCWIGSNVTILKNVHIGDNVVIGANCLIHKDIEKNSVVRLVQELLIDKY